MAQFYKDYTIDTTQNISFGLDFNVNDFIEACEGNGAILAQAVARLIDALDERVSHLIATQSVALAGGWASTVPVESGTALSGDKLQITKATPRNYFSEITKIRNAADESNFPMESLLVGGSAIREAFQATQAGCCASTGIDLWEAMRLYGYAFAYDRHLIQAHPDGQDGAMIVAPGALQLLQAFVLVVNFLAQIQNRTACLVVFKQTCIGRTTDAQANSQSQQRAGKGAHGFHR